MLPPLGEITRLKIGHDAAAVGAGWSANQTTRQTTRQTKQRAKRNDTIPDRARRRSLSAPASPVGRLPTGRMPP